MLSYKGVIFDLDGTLIDSMKIWQDIDVKFLNKRNIEVPDDYMESIAHLGGYATALYTIDRFNLNDKPEDLISEWVSMASLEYPKAKFKPGAEEYIDFLIKNNIKISIATATERELAVSSLKGKSFENSIETLVTVADVKRGKGYPDIYLKCAEDLGLKPSECIVFEDILEGIRASKAGGFYTVGVFEECNKNNLSKIKTECDKFIYSFTEMIK